jgi:radical SAM protein with 4Fe4S-binding SPASM domain
VISGAPPLPRELQVEVTGACNLRCRMCLVRYRPPLGRTVASMDVSRFIALLDALPGLRRLTLQGLGEPLLAPDFFEMIDAARGRDIEVGFNTNATVLTRAKCERLVAAGVDWLHVSVDGSTPETFEHIRDGARYDRVIANLRTLLTVKREARSDRPRVQLNAVVMRSNLDELPGIVRLAAELQVARCWVQGLSHDFTDTRAGEAGPYVPMRSFVADEQLDLTSPAVHSAFRAAGEIAASARLDLRLPGNESAEPRGPDELPCDWPFERAYVTHDGKVQPCCMVMGADRATLGDLREQSFADIWRGDAYRRFRIALLGDTPPDVCRGCAIYRRTF